MDSNNRVQVIVSSRSNHKVNPNKVAKRHESIKYLSAFLGSSNEWKESSTNKVIHNSRNMQTS